MVNAKKINIEVAYADSLKQHIVNVQLDNGSTIEQAIDCSGILMLFPDINLMRQKVGIFSKQKKLTDIVKEGDRVEIYRTLTMDPKEARKKRVKEKR